MYDWMVCAEPPQRNIWCEASNTAGTLSETTWSVAKPSFGRDLDCGRLAWLWHRESHYAWGILHNTIWNRVTACSVDVHPHTASTPKSWQMLGLALPHKCSWDREATIPVAFGRRISMYLLPILLFVCTACLLPTLQYSTIPMGNTNRVYQYQ